MSLIHQDIYNHTTFGQIKSCVPVPITPHHIIIVGMPQSGKAAGPTAATSEQAAAARAAAASGSPSAGQSGGAAAAS